MKMLTHRSLGAVHTHTHTHTHTCNLINKNKSIKENALLMIEDRDVILN